MKLVLIDDNGNQHTVVEKAEEICLSRHWAEQLPYLIAQILKRLGVDNE